jgi:small subunit ribosomal protein S4
LKPGDVLELRDRVKESSLYKSLASELSEFAKANKGKITNSKWIDVDANSLKITVKALPEKDDFEQIIDIQKIVEFYSK